MAQDKPLPIVAEIGDTLYVGIIEHKHGTNVYASFDQERIHAAIEAFCREWWQTEGVPGEPDHDVVPRYFQHVEGRESYAVHETELI